MLEYAKVKIKGNKRKYCREIIVVSLLKTKGACTQTAMNIAFVPFLGGRMKFFLSKG